MIRAATTADLTRLYDLVVEMHGRSVFAKRGIDLSPNLVRSVLMDGLRKHGGEHAGSTLLNVIDRGQGVEAFMLGLLQPIYNVCLGLEAQDYFLYASAKAPGLSAALLIDGYLAWTLPNERVRDIMLSWTDVVGVDGRKISRLYQRKGFQRCGEIWKRGAR